LFHTFKKLPLNIVFMDFLKVFLLCFTFSLIVGIIYPILFNIKTLQFSLLKKLLHKYRITFKCFIIRKLRILA
jgi:hypothetical protein